MRRILVVGPCGAGKSTLARQLGDILHLPVIHLDRLNWNPGWIMSSDEVFRARVHEASGGERWIIDGNYGSTLEIRLPPADTVVLLDFARWRCVGRVVRRIMRYRGRTRPDMGEGCPERFDWEFIEYVWAYHRENRPKLLHRLAALPREKRLIVLRTPGEVDDWLRELNGSNNLPRITY
jgi:adenylate kinase family enzyme